MGMRAGLITWIVLIFFLAKEGRGQSQLVLLKKERVVKLFLPGDDFIYREKGDKEVKASFINHLSDTAVITQWDTIPFHHLERVYFKRIRFINRLGYLMVVAGVGVMAIDLFNVVVVQGENFNMDPGLLRFSAVTVGLGLPLMLVVKKSQKIRHPFSIKAVKKGSPFYRDLEPKGYHSPYIPQ